MVIDTSKWTSGSWKTTTFGLISAASVFVLAYPQYFVKWPWVNALAGFIATGGLIGMGISGKDRNVTGGTTANPSSDPVVVAKTAAPAPPKA